MTAERGAGVDAVPTTAEAGPTPGAPGREDRGAPLPSRPQRADAVKNRRRILEAAEEVFASQGVSAPVDLVAEQAGVGVGTLYRHFPTKEALIEAIVVDAGAGPGGGDRRLRRRP